MIYNTELKIAVKNCAGRYCSKDTSIFELTNVTEHIPSLYIAINRQREIVVKVKCPICGEEHKYTYNIKDLLKRQMSIGGCEITGEPVCFIGKALKVSKFISKYDMISEKIYAMI